MDILYSFLLANEDGDTNTVPQDLTVSVIGSTQIFMNSKKNAVYSC